MGHRLSRCMFLANLVYLVLVLRQQRTAPPSPQPLPDSRILHITVLLTRARHSYSLSDPSLIPQRSMNLPLCCRH
ncbi:hypothetical protein LZ30DRAFT_15687 [Colletotrichum cereale]|nr:hypothetical protein LZ30DRAFT_15687 [Colletotrichum cereale]